MLDTLIIVKELRLLAEELNIMADDIQRNEERVSKEEQSLKLTMGRACPPGNKDDWIFISRKFRSLLAGVLENEPNV